MITNSPITDGCVEEISKLLSQHASAGKLPNANRWNVEPHFHMTNLGEVRFHFVTHDDISVRFDADLRTLRQKGRSYIEQGVWNCVVEIEKHRKDRQTKSRIVLLDS